MIDEQMEEIKQKPPSKEEERIARETLERYSGSSFDEFQSYLLLTNFPPYVEAFAHTRKLPIIEGNAFKVAHSPEENISILDFKIGSPSAALVIDLCAHLPVKAALMLGMCGGLRKQYKVGNYFVPVGSIRAEGTSDFYFDKEVPALANFLVQRAVTKVLEDEKLSYHIGITHTTNKRFWEFNEEFCQRIVKTRAQAIEMECATLFMASYYHKLPLGALLLISDLPLEHDGIKTKASAQGVFTNYTLQHVDLGVKIIATIDAFLKQEVKGAFRGPRRKFMKEG